MGTPKAIVLPDPVCAQPIISELSRIANGMACFWIGVGSVNFAKAGSKASGTCNEFHAILHSSETSMGASGSTGLAFFALACFFF